MSNIPIPNGQYKIGTTQSTAIAAGETSPIADPNDRSGWLFTKPATGTAKFNYYLYSDGTYPLTLGHITHLYANISMDTNITSSAQPWITIYTKSQGSGDAGPPTFPYHSKINYHIPGSWNCQLGEMITIHTHHSLIPEDFGYRKCWLSNRTVAGDALATEEIWYIVVQSQSGSPVDTEILVSNFGINTNRGFDRHLKLIS